MIKAKSVRTIVEAMIPNRFFARLNIASKMLLGYAMLVVLSVIVVAYVLLSLRQLNNLNEGVLGTSVPAQKAAEVMLDAVLNQDTYEKRFLILKRADTRSLFWKRGEEFDGSLTLLRSLPGQERFPLNRLEKLHRQYGDLFIREVKLVKAGNLHEAAALSNKEMKDKAELMSELLRAMAAQAKQSQDSEMRKIGELAASAFITTAVLCALSIVIGTLAGLLITQHIASSLRILGEATRRIAEGDYNVDVRIESKDEFGILSEAFRSMGQRLAKLETMYRDASPLTRLPGGSAIENEMKRRLASEQPLAFCMLDIDNFKSFNDRYGYAHGNVVIRETARLIERAVRTKGGPDDFVGHIGGDDFVVITTPAVMREVSGEIIGRFDERVPSFYDEQARNIGFISGKNRQGEETRFPLMTISIAIVTNERRRLESAFETSEIAAELKDYAKTIQKSVYVIDNRRDP